ncbi:MAG: hypothetical protein M0R51_11780 [Clostridia bacterium]|nr:hypothetical protein [Clostridia bacterium]
MAKFEPQYTEENFIEALGRGLKTTGYITKKVGCARKTAEVYLKTLERERKVEKVEIDDGQSNVWALKK